MSRIVAWFWGNLAAAQKIAPIFVVALVCANGAHIWMSHRVSDIPTGGFWLCKRKKLAKTNLQAFNL
ncbi:MAG: hypothetical protein ACMV16_01855 [Macromonas sp.]